MVTLLNKYNKAIIFAVILILVIFVILSKKFIIGSEIKRDIQINQTDFKQIIIDKTEDVAALGYPGQRKIVKDKAGNFYITYRKKYNSYYSIFVAKLSKDKNDEWLISGTDEPIVFIKADQRVPSIAIDSDDILHIVWYGSDSDNEPGNRQIKYSKSNDNGNTWDDWKNISQVSGYSNEDYWQEHPNISIGFNSELYVVWEGKDAQNKYQQIKFSKSIDGGQLWTKWVNVNVSPSNTQSRPSVVQDNRGKLYVLMYSSSDGPMQQVWYSYSNNDGSDWKNWQNVSKSSFDSRHISVSVDQEGILHAVWRSMANNNSPTQIYYSYLNKNNWSKPIVIAKSTNYQFFPSITIDENNIPFIVWLESKKNYSLPREQPEDGKIYFSYFLNKTEFSQAQMLSVGNDNFYPSFPNSIEDKNISVLFLNGSKIVFNYTKFN